MKTKPAHGFTLVEIAVVLTIIATLMGSGILALNSVIDDMRYKETQRKMNVIFDALSSFAQRNYFIPCAAQPSNPAATAGVATASCTQNNYGPGQGKGIVPYVTLGLKQEDVRDAYGNYITYQMNPIFAQNYVYDMGLSPPERRFVQNPCRIADIWVNTITNTNKNPYKAKFCCAVASGSYYGNDIAVLPDANSTLSNRLSPTRYGAVYTNEGDVNAAVSPPADMASNPDYYKTETAAVILTSHGKNGYGAYRVNNTNLHIDNVNGVSRFAEIRNGLDYQAEVIYRPYSSSQNSATLGYYDDIVMWKTQGQLMSAFGNNSCARP
jgi:prepilin-type N-terminal cleavage/methylation domain-containing protein